MTGETGDVAPARVIRWKMDFDKQCLLGCFDRRGWERCSDASDQDWHVYWANVGTVKQLFSPDCVYRLRDGQLINHFPNHYELTRKDLLVKNIKRYRKELLALQQQQQQQRPRSSAPAGPQRGTHWQTVADADVNPGALAHVPCNFLPPTYVLPVDYSLFLEEFRRNPNSVWIMKPTSKARGVGIFLVTKLHQIKKWASKGNGQDVYVISKYIERPLLIGGRKFDLRMYVLVTSYRPLKAFLYQDGFARFCNEKYSGSAADRDNHYMHLTNVAVQKHNEDYNENHGGKWSLANLRLYLQAMYGADATARLFEELESVILVSIKAVQNVIMNERHCFECYGYDLLIDENLKVWLIEVNASPALTATTKSDRSLKHSLVHNIFNILLPEDLPENPKEREQRMQEIIASSNFVTLCNEESSATASSALTSSSSSVPARRVTGTWR
ncbi:Tubulin polyglutamylase TTLL5 [Hondaea fermentalgiana]|uniref:Tubulin polyglutamylase TTLL5 n=1 Tax=Hondaea fermentalgiana TaxID=2315210 RepID=A0A2R5G3L6_9STRA|nr:Tubulin polyglutamylase TTLL5 [Hondaea fermentalgiana]|eukprot:GBG25125.1 Tubulin polyglutamylase TTLL5 [Hondaea fermentalgiana]